MESNVENINALRNTMLNEAAAPGGWELIGTDHAMYIEIYNDTSGLKANAVTSPSYAEGHRYAAVVGSRELCQVNFQQGPVPDNGINGLTNEVLLAILIHRTEFLDSKYPCNENKMAIESMKDALWSLEERTRKRVVRGVEGKHIT